MLFYWIVKKEISILAKGGETTAEPIPVNCTVAYMSQCMSWNKCKNACMSMGASSYRWFHDGCCECVGFKIKMRLKQVVRFQDTKWRVKISHVIWCVVFTHYLVCDFHTPFGVWFYTHLVWFSHAIWCVDFTRHLVSWKRTTLFQTHFCNHYNPNCFQ